MFWRILTCAWWNLSTESPTTPARRAAMSTARAKIATPTRTTCRIENVSDPLCLWCSWCIEKICACRCCKWKTNTHSLAWPAQDLSCLVYFLCITCAWIWPRIGLRGGWGRHMALRNRESHARNDDDDTHLCLLKRQRELALATTTRLWSFDRIFHFFRRKLVLSVARRPG